MANDIKQQLNQLLIRIDAAVLAQDYESVESLIIESRTKLDNVRMEIDPDLSSSVENSLTTMLSLVSAQRTSEQPCQTRYIAESPKKKFVCMYV